MCMIFSKFLSGALVLCLGLLLASQPAMAQEGACQKITISGPSIWPPHVPGGTETQRRSGPAFNLATQVFKALGVEVIYAKPKPWKRVLRQLRNGDIDLTVALLDDKERRNHFEYSVPWTEDVYGVVTLKNNDFDYKTVKNLKGRLGGYYAGILLPPPLDAILTDAYLVAPIDDVINLYRVLHEKRMAYLVVSVSAFYSLMPDTYAPDDFTFIEKSAVHLPVHMAFSRISPCLKYLEQLNFALDQYRVAASK